MDIRSAIIQRITERFMRLRAAFERFDDEAAEREKVGPKWNVRDLAGHLAYWTAEAAREIEAQKRDALSQSHSRGRLGHTDDHSREPGQAFARQGEARLSHIDKVNDEVYRKNRRMSFVMLRPKLREAEENLLTALRAVPAESLVGETPVRQLIDEAVVGHYDHHWPGLKAAVARSER